MHGPEGPAPTPDLRGGAGTLDAAAEREGQAEARTPDRPGEALVDLGALAHNFDRARALAGARVLYPVIKADAYGHGAVPVARALARAGADRFAVVSVKEAAELRSAGIHAPLLVLGGVSNAAEARTAVKHGLTPAVHDRAALELLADVSAGLGRPLRVHVEVDTGMRRMGVPVAEAADLLARIVAEPALELEGLYTHFVSADDESPSASLRQLEQFRAVLVRARERGIEPPLVHADNSAALFAGTALARALPEANAARPGLMLYGVAPAAHLEADSGLLPVMTLCGSLLAVRDAAEGDTVGYHALHRFVEATRVGTVALGYADGVPVSLGPEGVACVRGVLRPLVGRVSMDYFGLDVGRTGAELGDRVVLFGDAVHAGRPAGESDEALQQRRAALRAERQARRAGTIAYELLVRVGGRVPRRYIEPGAGDAANGGESGSGDAAHGGRANAGAASH